MVVWAFWLTLPTSIRKGQTLSTFRQSCLYVKKFIASWLQYKLPCYTASQSPNQRYFQKQLYLHPAVRGGPRQAHSPLHKHTAGPIRRKACKRDLHRKDNFVQFSTTLPRLKHWFRFTHLCWQRLCRRPAHTHPHYTAEPPVIPRQPKHTSNKMCQRTVSLSIHSFIFCLA